MKTETVLIFVLHIEQRTLHLGKRESIAVVQLIYRVQKVAECAAGHFEDLLEAVCGEEADERVAKELHVRVVVAALAKEDETLGDLRKEHVRIDVVSQYLVALYLQVILYLIPYFDAKSFYNCILYQETTHLN